MQTAYDLSGGGDELPKFALTQFTVEEFQKFWPQLEEMLDSVPHTWRYWTKDHIYQSVVNDMVQVWGVGPPPKATFVMMTTVNIYPSMKVLTAVWAAGMFDDGMIPLIDAAMTSYARLNNCGALEIRGRPGWDPKFRSVGFQREAMIWTRYLKDSKLN
jgi:hypothetical protein